MFSAIYGSHVSLFVFYLQQAFGFFAMVSFGLLAGIMVFVIITQHFSKSGSGDPSSHYTEEPEPRNWVYQHVLLRVVFCVHRTVTCTMLANDNIFTPLYNHLFSHA